MNALFLKEADIGTKKPKVYLGSREEDIAYLIDINWMSSQNLVQMGR